MGDKDSLGDRIKKYESSFKQNLPPRMPVIVRCDGKAFSSYTSKCKEAFDETMCSVMDQTAIKLCEEIQGAQMAYVQSDEISILVHSYKRFTSQAWFNNEIQKICSVTAGIASATFTSLSNKISFNQEEVRPAVFDSRAFVLPENEVCNYFWWRQKDCERNSVSTLARTYFSSTTLHKKNSRTQKEMLAEKGVIWEELSSKYKFGRIILTKETENKRKEWSVMEETPLFINKRELINQLLETEE